jgi:DNA-binding response OmpR family regulator
MGDTDPVRGRILVVEDDRRTADLVELYLGHAGHRVVVERDGAAALERIRSESFDLCVLDVMLPGVDGFALCGELRRLGGTPVILLTARTLEEDRLAGFELGADDYVTKPFSPRELVARTQSLLRRVPPSGDGLRVGALHIDTASRAVRLGEHRVRLTPSEYEILCTLARRPGMVFSRRTLLERLPVRSADTLERTVDVHVRNLRTKLGPAAAGDAVIETVFGAGYRLRPAAGAR